MDLGEVGGDDVDWIGLAQDRDMWRAFMNLGMKFRVPVVGLERGSLSLMSTIEELLERKSSGSGLGSREYGRRDPSR
jgi:hypothetical protein